MELDQRDTNQRRDQNMIGDATILVSSRQFGRVNLPRPTTVGAAPLQPTSE